MKLNKIYLLALFFMVSCGTTKVVKVESKAKQYYKPRRLSVQAKILKCTDYFMENHGVDINAAKEYCFGLYRR